MSDGKQAQIDLTRDKEGNLTAANLLVDGKVEQQTAFGREESEEANLESELLEPTVATRELKDKNGDSTTAYFDDFDRVIAEDSPTTGWTHYEWNAEDNLTEVTNELAQKINITYDGFGRIIDIITNDDSAKVLWGDYNQKKSVISSDYQLHYVYDQLGNITQKTWQFTDQSFSANYKYNGRQQLETVDYPSGLSLNYSYDKKGHLDQIKQKSWLKDKVLVSNLSDKNSYDNQSTFNFGNGVSQTQVYRDNEVVEWTGNKDIAYSYSTPYQGGFAIGYAYPSVNNDSSASTNSASQNNQSTQNSNNAAPTEPSKAVAQTTTTADQYNSIGQLLQESGRDYSYDSLGRLIQVTNNKSSIVTYDYLITGERYKKSVLANNQANQTTYYLYDNGILISELTQTATEDKPQFTDYVYLNNRPLLQFNGLEPFYLTTDHRGAVMAVTDIEANVVWQAYLTDNGQAQVFNGSQIAMNLRGSNQYYDAETDLHYNIHRYFSPTRNQYLTPDPVGLAAGEDLYAFANDRPHEFVDLWGLAPEGSASTMGTYIHNNIFAPQILRKGIADLPVSTWGSQNARHILGKGFTWPTGVGKKGKGALSPDAYYVDIENRKKEDSGKSFKGEIWELKPVSYLWNDAKYLEAKKQLQTYIKGAKRGKWSAGCVGKLNLAPSNFMWNGEFKQVSFFDDYVPLSIESTRRIDKPSGLVFYAVKDSTKKRKAQALSEAANALEKSTLAESVKQKLKQVKDAASDLTTPEKVGIGIIIVAVIIAAIAIYSIGIAVILAAIAAALSWVLTSGLAIVTAL